MKVAYDLRYATDHFPGIGTHAHHLLDALLDRRGGPRWSVIWNPALRNTRFDLDRVRAHPAVDWVDCRVPALSLRAPWSLGALLRRLAPDAYISPFVLMPFGAACPSLLTLHDVLPLSRHGDLPWLRREVFRASVRAARSARFVMTSSAFSRDELVRLGGLDPARVRVVRPGAPVRRRGAERRPTRAPDAPFALVVGVNKPHKNLATLVAAWLEMGAAPPLRLVGVGPTDPRYPSLERLAAGHPAIHALGRVAEDELEWLYRHATLVLFPTLYEGFGFPLLEAASCGVPVLASDIPALREIGEGVARFVAPLDPAAWAKAVRTLASDSTSRERMAGAGAERVAKLDYRSCAGEVMGLLDELADG